MYQRLSIFLNKKAKRGLSILCLVVLCLCDPVFSGAETEMVTYGALTFRVSPEDGTSYLVVNGYDAAKDSTGDVSIEKSYSDAGKTRKVVGVDSGVFKSQTLSSLHIKSDVSGVKYIIGTEAFKDIHIGSLQNSGAEDICTFQGGKDTIIGPRAFSGAQIGGNVKIDVTNGQIHSAAFQNAEISGVLQITGTIDTLKKDVFSGMRAKALHLSPNVANIETRAFADSYIMEYKLESSLKTIGSRVFEGCEHLKKIILPEKNSGVEVAEDAFPDSEGLTIVIPEGLTNLSIFHLESYSHVVFQTAENLTEDSPVIRYLKENSLTYKIGENGKVNVPDVTPEPTEKPTMAPPTEEPTEKPTERPTQSPTEKPTLAPPTEEPTEKPTERPTQSPTEKPTMAPPTEEPTEKPTEQPTQSPTEKPTMAPPTEEPTEKPTEQPTQTPTEQPTQKQTEPSAEQPIQFSTEQPAQSQTPLPVETVEPAGGSKKTYTIRKIKYRIKDEHTVVVTGAVSRRLRKLQIPDMVTVEGRLHQVVGIEKKAFRKHKNLKTVLVGNYVTEIGDEAFAKCTRLTKIQFGTGVKTLGKRVLYQDRRIKKIIFKGKRLKVIGKKTFSGVPRRVDIRADKTMVKKYAGLINRSKK